MEKLEGMSLDLTKLNIEKLKELFPMIDVDGKIDFDMLRTILGDEVDDSREKYQFTWNGKTDSIRLAQSPSSATLRPCKEESKDWDTTENLYIEGDNLEVLKQLQKTYYGKVKMIYIDPPYNTGNDFIYKDDFKNSIANYKEQTEQGMSSNPETNGRYHTDWLNMMYPRLVLARNLLCDDGIVFISIDEKEISNLTKICNEIFGDKNHLETFHMQVRYSNKSLNEDNDFQPVMEYVLVYVKDNKKFIPNKHGKEYDLSKFCYSFKELTPGETVSIGNKVVTIFKSDEWSIEKHDIGKIGLLKETWASGSIVRQSGTAAEFLAKYLIDRKSIDGLGVLYKIHNMGEDGLGYRYVTGPQKKDAIRGKFYSGVPLDRIEELKSGNSLKYKPITNFYDYSSDFGNIRNEGEIAFNGGKKPIKMLKELLFISNLKDNDIVMDFFSGSASLAHSVMEYNFNNNKNINYLLVQIPEKVDSSHELYKLGYKNICEIGKERIRRAGELIKKEYQKSNPDKEFTADIGFKVFKLDSTNIKPWENINKLHTEQLSYLEEVFKKDRNKEDILYEILLKYGLFDMSVSEVDINGKTMYRVGRRYMLVCLEDNINASDIKKIIELSPRVVVFKETGFNNDNDKINAEYNLKKAGIEEIKCI